MFKALADLANLLTANDLKLVLGLGKLLLGMVGQKVFAN